jgi:hypothetical protein
MGLDAFVYRSRTRLAFDPSTPGVSIDDTTGLIDFDDPELYRRFADHVVALHYRIGNVALINQLQEEISGITAAHFPTIGERVLGDGAHCGDFIELSRLDALEQELDLLVAATARSRSPYLDDFLLHMRELVRAARAENNPIYFG